MISGSALFTVLLWLVAAGLIFYVLNWFIAYVELKPPFLLVAKVIIGIVVVVMLINAIATLFGTPFVKW